MSALDLLILTAAAWYFADALTNQKCPFNLCVWIREHFPLGGLTTCIYCAIPYFAAVLFAIYWFSPAVFYPFVIPFGIAGLALMLRSYTGAGMHE